MTENELARIVVFTAIDVHKQLGPGLLENVYKECLFQALCNAGLAVEKEVPLPVVFQGIKMACGYRLDILVEG